MHARKNHPAMILPGAMPAPQALATSADREGLPAKPRELVHLRASQINGCSVHVALHARGLKRSGESDERLFAAGAWRDAPYFPNAERAALALTGAVTRLSDRADPAPDAIWEDAARHYEEEALAALLLTIAQINVWNRLNAATRQIAGVAGC